MTTTVKSKERLRALKRLLPTLSESEAKRVSLAFENNEKTGYATVDRPWEEFYKDIEYRNHFLNTTPYQGLVSANKNYPKEEAMEYFGANITFGELLDYIEVVAKSLEEYGVKKGDFVTVCSTATPEVVYLFYALSKIGAVVNAISPFYEPKDLMNRINECDSKLVIVVDKFLPFYKDALNKDKSKNVVVLPMMNSSWLRFIKKPYLIDGRTNEISWKTFISDGKHRPLAAEDPYEYKKPQAMVYSSGTTGASKGIILSVDSFQKLVNAYGNSGFDTSRGLKVYHNAPPWSSTGLSLGINFPLSFGVKVCTDPRFEQMTFIKNIMKFKPEYVLSDTSMYQGFTTLEAKKYLKGKSLSFLKYPVEGGEPLVDREVNDIEGQFALHGAPVRLLNGYGQCECGATITTDITSKKFANNASGIPLPNIATVGIFDDNFNELKYGERGNIVAMTEIGMNNYFNRPEETSKFFKKDINGDEWSMTGDIGYMNPDGSLVVLGRKSDYSIINGDHIYNFDVEHAILESRAIKLCEVQSHPEDSNKLVAHIIWEPEVKRILEKDPSRIDYYISEIQDNVLKKLNNPNAIPNYFCFKDKFPTASSGKRDWKGIKENVEGLVSFDYKDVKKK